MRKIIFLQLFALAFFSTICFSQTIINYQAWTGASGCNIFGNSTNVPATINSANGTIEHLTAIGQPTYDNINKSVNLESQFKSTSQNFGTEYRTSVNFKKGYAYKITVNAARIMSTQTGPNVLLRIDLNNGGSGNNNTCNGTGTIDANGSGGLKHSLPISSTSFNDYVFDYSPLSDAQAYMMVAAIPPVNSVLQTVLIRKITITETAPAPPPASFTLPATTIITCGQTNPVTFTVTNVNNTTGVTDYTWNLGATPNGWLYNGTPAQQTISTGATSSITLAPDPNSKPKDVSATVTANGSSYNTNTSVVSFSQSSYSFSVSGPAVICSSANYAVPGLPAGATVTWSASSGIVSLAPNGAQVTVTGLLDGNVDINATVTLPCGQSVPASSKYVRVGNYTTPYFYIYGPTYVSNGQLVQYWVPSYPNVYYEWTFSDHFDYAYGQYTPTITLRTKDYIYSPSPASVTVTFHDVCNDNTSTLYVTVPSYGYYYSVSPNPATSEIKVETTTPLQEDAVVQLVDLYTGQKVYSKKLMKGSKQILLKVGHLKRGQYLLVVKDKTGKTISSKQVVLK